MKLINLTGQKEEVHYFDGTCFHVLPGCLIDIDISKMYSEELARVLTVFKEVNISKPVPETSFQKKSSFSKKEDEINNGGNS